MKQTIRTGLKCCPHFFLNEIKEGDSYFTFYGELDRYDVKFSVSVSHLQNKVFLPFNFVFCFKQQGFLNHNMEKIPYSCGIKAITGDQKALEQVRGIATDLKRKHSQRKKRQIIRDPSIGRWKQRRV